MNSTKLEEGKKVVLNVSQSVTSELSMCILITHANITLHLLRRKYLSLEKRKLLCNAYIKSQFNCALLVWMFSRKKKVIKDSKDSPQSTKGDI